MRISGGIYAELRKKKAVTFYVRLGWTENGKRINKKITTRWKVPHENYDYKKSVISAVDDRSIKIRNKIQATEDFIKRLDLPTQEENVAAVRNFVFNEEELIQAVVPTKFRDFILEYITINNKLMSSSRIKQYKNFKENMELYVENRKTSDVFTSMSRTQQTAFLSDFANFLMEEHFDKPAYENATTIQEFNKIAAIRKVFPEAGVLVEPLSVVRHLRTGQDEAVYCTMEEVNEIIKLRGNLTKSPAEWKALSLFLFSVVTGLRFSELKTVVENAIQTYNGFTTLTYASGKKGRVTQVPLSSLALRILNEEANRRATGKIKIYSGQLLPVLSASSGNKFLHLALKRIPLLERKDTRVRYIGAEQVQEEIPRWKAISMHSARHTFSHILTSSKLSLNEVGSLMSHGSVETTNKHYKHVLNDSIQKAAFNVLNEIS